MTAYRIETCSGVALSSGDLTAIVKLLSLGDGHLAAAAAIAWSKMAALTASVVPVLNASGVMTASSVTATELAFLAAALTRTLSYTDAGAAAGPVLTLMRESASPAANDLIGALTLSGRNSSAAQIAYASLAATITDATAGSEDSRLAVFLVVAGVVTEIGRWVGSGLHLLNQRLYLNTAATTYLEVDGGGVLRAVVLGVEVFRLSTAGIFEARTNDDGAGIGPAFRMVRISASPAASDLIGALEWYGRDSGAADELYARLVCEILDPTAASEDARLRAYVDVAGTLTEALRITGTGIALPPVAASRTLGTDSSSNVVAIGGIREVLLANRTYYVRTDGSDSNTGLANSAGGAFLTVQRALDVVGALDLSTFAVTIQLGNTGNYAGWNAGRPFVGGPGSSVTLLGDTAAAASYVFTSTCTIQKNCVLILAGGYKFTPSAGDGLVIDDGGSSTIAGVIHFGAASGQRQILVSNSGRLIIGAVLTCAGNAANFILATTGALVSSNGFAHVYSGTPAFSVANIQAQGAGASVSIVNGAPTGSATGKRYDSTLNAVIFTNGGGANFFPGNVAGTATTGLYA